MNDQNGWAQWRGGPPPKLIIEVMFRRGVIGTIDFENVSKHCWTHNGSASDIVSYRLRPAAAKEEILTRALTIRLCMAAICPWCDGAVEYDIKNKVHKINLRLRNAHGMERIVTPKCEAEKLREMLELEEQF